MPTVVREKGYTFTIYPNDHPPAHCHVTKDDNEAKIGLDPITVLDNWGFNNREIKQILALAQKHQEKLLSVWDSLHPSR